MSDFSSIFKSCSPKFIADPSHIWYFKSRSYYHEYRVYILIILYIFIRSISSLCVEKLIDVSFEGFGIIFIWVISIGYFAVLSDKELLKVPMDVAYLQW